MVWRVSAKISTLSLEVCTFAKTFYNMIFLENEGNTNHRLNLALEEYALRNFSAENDYLLFYINEPSIIIGRNQNTLEEINHEYIEQNNIHVV